MAPIERFQPLSRPLIEAIGRTAGGPAWRGSDSAGWRGGSVWTRYLHECESGERWMIVATIDDVPVGYAGLLFRSQYEPHRLRRIPEINDIVVSEAFLRRGIATRMIAAIEQHAADAGYKIIGLGVGLHAGYGSAQRLYVRLGFLPDGRGVAYRYEPVTPYTSVCADDHLCLWMQKTLQANAVPTLTK